MNNLSGNNTPCQDSGIGHANSVTSSAPDGSITDTPSPSLDMSLPSTSYHTSGSGLTTLEVDNDNMPYQRLRLRIERDRRRESKCRIGPPISLQIRRHHEFEPVHEPLQLH